MDKKPHPDDHEPGGVQGVSMDSREVSVQAREDAAAARELAASSRELELVDREAEAQLRDESLRARAEADDIRAERELLFGQTRDANERLVLATMKADELVEIAAYNEERF